MISVFPRLHTSILTLSTCPLKNMLHSTWCVIASPTFTVPFTFLTKSRFFNFSILNPFSLAKAVSMNKPIAPPSNNAFTAALLWLSSFSSLPFIYTSHSSRSVHCTSLTLSVILENFNLLPNFSGCNTLYRLLEASQELTVLYYLLLTLIAFLLSSSSSISPSNFWPYGPTFHTHSKFCLLPFLCSHPLLRL